MTPKNWTLEGENWTLGEGVKNDPKNWTSFMDVSLPYLPE